MFETQNAVWVHIHKGIKEGVFKNCVHLQIAGGTYSPYRPYCAKDSLIAYNRNQFEDVCPQKCYLFEDKKAVEKAQKKTKRREPKRAWWRAFWRTVLKPFTLPWQTQTLIVVSLFVGWGLATNQLKTVLEIVRALRGCK